MGRVVRVVPLLALVVVPFAGAQSSAPVLLLESTERHALYVVDAGGNATPLTAGKPAPSGGSAWSPDGSRVAYVSGQYGRRDIYAVGVDGRGLVRLTNGGDNESARWSPDGSRIAYVHGECIKRAGGGCDTRQDIWLVDPDGGNADRLTRDGTPKYNPQWSPDGKRLLYSGSWTVVVDAGSGRVLLRTTGGGGAWSPDGARIALAAGRGIEVVDADGSDRREVAGPGPGRGTTTGSPAWSPDGTRIAFLRSHCTAGVKGLCGLHLGSIYVVGADGKDEQRLTGPVDDGPGSTVEGFPLDFGNGVPSWWPDGRQLFGATLGSAGLFALNADGGCERAFRPDLDPNAAAWRPGATPPPPPRCVNVDARVDPDAQTVGVRGPAHVTVTVTNDGNETATAVKLALWLVRGGGRIVAPLRTCRRAPRLECELPPSAPGGVRRVPVAVAGVRPTRLGSFELHARVTAAETDVAGGGNEGVGHIAVIDCDIVGTIGADRLVGTRGRDRICARAGADVVDARGGDDVVDAGTGLNRIYLGAGHDTIRSYGRDRVYARDGERDVIRCVRHATRVYADRVDEILGRCKLVARR